MVEASNLSPVHPGRELRYRPCLTRHWNGPGQRRLGASLFNAGGPAVRLWRYAAAEVHGGLEDLARLSRDVSRALVVSWPRWPPCPHTRCDVWLPKDAFHHLRWRGRVRPDHRALHVWHRRAHQGIRRLAYCSQVGGWRLSRLVGNTGLALPAHQRYRDRRINRGQWSDPLSTRCALVCHEPEGTAVLQCFQPGSDAKQYQVRAVKLAIQESKK